MIYRMAQDLAANLQARKYPVHVFYGPERLTREGNASYRAIFKRDRMAGDSVAPPMGQQQNPRKARVRALGVVVDLHVAASVSGARQNEHEHECDKLVDALLTALDDWAKEARAGSIEYLASRYLNSEEYDETEYAAGVVYRMVFRVQRGVVRRDYDGGIPSEAAIQNTSFTTTVSSGEDTEDVP